MTEKEMFWKLILPSLTISDQSLYSPKTFNVSLSILSSWPPSECIDLSCLSFLSTKYCESLRHDSHYSPDNMLLNI